MIQWKYKDAKVKIKMDEFERTVSGYLTLSGSLKIKVDTRDMLERKLGFPIEGNIEIVMQMVGIRVPPDTWCKVIE